jgi:hypothetical protein
MLLQFPVSQVPASEIPAFEGPDFGFPEPRSPPRLAPEPQTETERNLRSPGLYSTVGKSPFPTPTGGMAIFEPKLSESLLVLLF